MNRLDPAIANAKRLCGLSSERLPPMSMGRYIVELQEGMQTLLKELDDALVIANATGYSCGYDDGFSDGKEEGYHKRALEYPA